MASENKTLQLQILSPAAKLYDEAVFEVVLPATEGEIGIMPDHIPYLSGLKKGVIAVAATNGQKPKPLYQIESGFVEFRENKLIVLTSSAVQI